MALNLLQKTELWITGITLEQANLTLLAQTAARVLGLPAREVLVVDVRPNTVTLDILTREVPESNLLGKERALLSALASLPGVALCDAAIHSNGILGLICAEGGNSGELLQRVQSMPTRA